MLLHEKGGMIGLSALSAAAPLMIGMKAVPAPDGLPLWAVMIISALGPISVKIFWHVGKSIALAAAAYFRARAKVKRELAEKMLADKDPKNDQEAIKIKLASAAEDAAAAAIEEAARKMPEK